MKRTERVEQHLMASHFTGQASERDVEEFNVHPNIIKGLPTGEAAVVCAQPRWVDVVRLDLPAPQQRPKLVLRARQLPTEAPEGGVCLHRVLSAPKPRGPVADGKQASNNSLANMLQSTNHVVRRDAAPLPKERGTRARRTPEEHAREGSPTVRVEEET
jgi:hypothetical protein